MLSSTKYPIEICCVVADHSEIDKGIDIVNEYTSNLGLKFNLREYNSLKYEDDRYSVTSLPAFHVYFEKIHMDTFYPDDDILGNIDESIKKYEIRKIETKKFIERWKNFLIFWKTKTT